MLVRTIACILACGLWTGIATAQPRDWDEGSGSSTRRYDQYDRYQRYEPRFGLRGGIGFTADPGTFLAAFEVPYSITRNWTVGPVLQVGVSDRETLVAGTLTTRYFIDLGQRPTYDDWVFKIRPFIHGGLGFVHVDLDPRGRDIDDTTFMFNLGFGAEYPLTERISLGSEMAFNVMPSGALGENFYFSWQMVTARLKF